MSRSGYYLLKNGPLKDDIKVTYCNMSKELEEDALNLKPKSSYKLAAVRHGDIPESNITNFSTLYETGSSVSAFNSQTGILKVPKTGTYKIAYSGECVYSARVYIDFRVNGVKIMNFMVSTHEYRQVGDTSTVRPVKNRYRIFSFYAII